MEIYLGKISVGNCRHTHLMQFIMVKGSFTTVKLLRVTAAINTIFGKLDYHWLTCQELLKKFFQLLSRPKGFKNVCLDGSHSLLQSLGFG